MIKVNMVKALEIKKNYIRQERQQYFEKLDVEYTKALENDDVKRRQDISARKQALRDATKDPQLFVAKTPEELKNVVPSAIEYERNQL